jgi:hypothetical protein
VEAQTADMVSSILGHKGHRVWSVSPDESVFQAISAMADKRIGALFFKEDPRRTPEPPAS